MYTKDLIKLLQLLEVSQQSGLLVIGREGESWQAFVLLQAGHVLACQIDDLRQGRGVICGARALGWLGQRGALEWRLEKQAVQQEVLLSASFLQPDSQREEPSPSTEAKLWGGAHRQISSPHSPSSLPRVPYRIGTTVGGSGLRSREARQIFALVDGKRTPEDIARLLHKSLHEIVPVLREMERLGLIRYEH
ncbi:hypothetical protein EPA93_11370 [Ktedonosporobacter rubrisoli]|uniref:Uncharacterized protein n=1 Tax=Ktedonosporobacter rubrisoli TaxID=2509675 RepID=A0A4P6JMQ9_KTERU|nr:DUF4388 domain-containing protein [Ktedonosporobacter rubrisoli]QBD76568.1 hypothetical protein EPA93_11370 [Ktedonosporobacter rubrisoli]